MKSVLKKCTICIKRKNSETIQAVLAKVQKGYVLTFFSEFQGKRIHHINKLEINDPANFVASYISRKYSNNNENKFASVTALDKNYRVISKVDVVVKILGLENKISVSTLKHESDILPELLQYTKCSEINALLNMCNQPLDYDRKLSQMFTDTHTRILRLKKDGVDVYVNAKAYKIYIASNKKELYFIDNINKSKYISNIITKKRNSKKIFSSEEYYKV